MVGLTMQSEEQKAIADTVKNEIRNVIESQRRKINKYDINSPAVDEAIISLLEDYTDSLVEDTFEASALPDGSTKQKIRMVTSGYSLKAALEKNPLVCTYGGSTDEVFITLAGSVISRVSDAMSKIGKSVPVEEEMMELLTGVSKTAVYVSNKHKRIHGVTIPS